MGRPSKYKTEYDELTYRYCLLGATDKQLADFFDTSEQTINAWKKTQPSFLESLKKGKELADASVAEALYHRALGYSHPDSKVFMTSEGPEVVNIIKHYPPDTAAAFIWLKNRAGWKDKQDLEHSGDIGLKDMSDDDLNKRLEELESKQSK
jgi:hypothetical protein